MQPKTLVGIALELVGLVAAPGPYPADARVGRFFRSKRFLGSHDRRLLGDAVFAWLRHGPRARARWGAWAASIGRTATEPGGEPDRRLFHLLDILALAADGLLPFDMDTALAGARAIAAEAAGEGGAAALDLVERALAADGWPGADAWPAGPLDRLAAELSLPRWIAERLAAERGEAAARALGSALLAQAPVDMRVNPAKIGRDAARRSLEEDTGAGVEPTPWSPLGLRIARRRNLTGTRASREGWIEIEDEGSQLTALSLDAAPGMDVIDACAGAGGKTLALAGMLFPGGARHGAGRAGSLTACDISAGKLAELERRARDAGVAGRIRTALIAPEGPLPERIGPADLVLVDAPCSGLGTLRRNPELKLRHGPDDVRAFARLQRAILERFLPLVRPGGRMAYATCSILAEENEDVAAAFAAAHPGLEEVGSSWAAAHLPAACREGARLRIDPVTAGTDGFFLAMWRRSG